MEAKETRRTRSRPINKDDVRFIYENYLDMSASEIAEARGISKFQVQKVVSELRKRGVYIPTKTRKRPNPIDLFVEELERNR